MLIITGFFVLAISLRVSEENGSENKQVLDAILYFFTPNDFRLSIASG